MELRSIKNEKTRFVVNKILQATLVLLGTFVISFANAFFLMPFNIVGGGMSGIGIILAEFGWLTVDIWQYILYWGAFLLGGLLLGFKFTFNTLLSTIFYPIFLSILVRTSAGLSFVDLLCGTKNAAELIDGVLTVSNWTLDSGRLLVIALFGGCLVGIGSGLTFVGGGSSGGVDIIAFIINKYSNMAISACTFIIDAAIVLTGLVVDLLMPESFDQATVMFFAGLVGVVTAFGCSFGIDKVYTTSLSSYICDVISDKHEEIIDFAINDVGRTATTFKVVGGYTNKEKTMVRIIFSKREYIKVKDGIARIDPNAFATYTATHSVNGEGFSRNVSSKTNSIDEAKALISYFKNKKQKKNNKEITNESINEKDK